MGKENRMSSIVETTAGKVEGFKKDNLHIFLGIPFAAPPVGVERETMILGEKSGIENAPLEEERLIWGSAPDEAFRWG